ncbi:sugar transferase [Aeromicrobium yanjiei]|uniref:sugar transferase n=1 Tax=Aeromicrobium yanjiei TaxID=2662028 RepID=UPI0018928EDC|nr:sugar transferase [Aeromicrobium yanjiei]
MTDLSVLAVTTGLAQFWRFGTTTTVRPRGPFDVSYHELGALIVFLWWVSLHIFQTRDERIIGDGPDEYRRVTRATTLMFGWIAIVSLMFKWDMSRGYLAFAFPLGLIGLLCGRKAWRVWLRRNRRMGRHLSNVLIVGGPQSAEAITLWFQRHSDYGLKVTGVWVPDASTKPNQSLDVPNERVPVFGNNHNLLHAIGETEADTVIVTDTEHLGHHGLRDLTWQLEGVDVDLMVSPNVVDFAGSRIHVRAVAGMPLIHLEEPQYAEAGAWPKASFDRGFSLVLLLLASPLLLVAATAVKATSKGPVFYRHRRIGLNGAEFFMLKFRSMRVGADTELSLLMAAQGGATTPLFKVKDDPRITRVGKFLRRYSIDELPQLINVLRGDMSLVGPRPQVAAEVELYDDRAHRRLRVRPGMTGLWQVSGRSDLTWDDAIHLDTYYVENWSLTGDLVIIWKTFRAVLGSSGAY